MTYSEDEVRAANEVAKIRLPFEEAKKRWPDFAFTSIVSYETGSGKVRRVEARWTDGVPRALKILLRPNATRDEVEDAKENIARQALFDAEVRKLRGG